MWDSCSRQGKQCQAGPGDVILTQHISCSGLRFILSFSPIGDSYLDTSMWLSRLIRVLASDD